MDDCSQNALCVSLPPEVRRRLCENCIKASYAQDTIMPIDTNHPIVIVEGIVLAVSSDKPLLLMAPGSLLLTPYFTAAEGHTLAQIGARGGGRNPTGSLPLHHAGRVQHADKQGG